MTVQELIEEARGKCPEFKRKIDHRLNKRKKSPEFDWLFKELTRVLGVDFLKEAARQELDKVKSAGNNTDSHKLHIQSLERVSKDLNLN